MREMNRKHLAQLAGWVLVCVAGLLATAMFGVADADDHGSGVNVVCSRTMSARTCDLLAVPIENELQRLEAPADWQWVILDGKDWHRAVRMFHVEGRTNKAFTVLKLRTTFLHGDFLQQHRPRPTLYILAHELGHYRCRCASEKRADQIAEQMMLAAVRPQEGSSGP